LTSGKALSVIYGPPRVARTVFEEAERKKLHTYIRPLAKSRLPSGPDGNPRTADLISIAVSTGLETVRLTALQARLSCHQGSIIHATGGRKAKRSRDGIDWLSIKYLSYSSPDTKVAFSMG
jgi:hypothetical protein